MGEAQPWIERRVHCYIQRFQHQSNHQSGNIHGASIYHNQESFIVRTQTPTILCSITTLLGPRISLTTSAGLTTTAPLPVPSHSKPHSPV